MGSGLDVCSAVDAVWGGIMERSKILTSKQRIQPITPAGRNQGNTDTFDASTSCMVDSWRRSLYPNNQLDYHA